jgi:putative SOS response-associated peptidase YedK
MPVFLNEETKTMWLDPTVSFHDCFKAIMNSQVYKDLSFYEVSELVNSVKHDNPEVIIPKKEYDELTYKRGIGRFFGKMEEGKEP